MAMGMYEKNHSCTRPIYSSLLKMTQNII